MWKVGHHWIIEAYCRGALCYTGSIKYLSISANLSDKLWPRVREEGFSTVFHKHWVARKSKDAENTSLGAVRGSGLYTNICVSAEGTSCVGKVRPHLQVAVG